MQWNQKVFNQNIDKIIKEKCGGVQKEFNRRVGPRDAATRWKTEKPSLGYMIKIANEFGCSLDWLILGGGSPHPSVAEEPDAYSGEDPKITHLLGIAKIVLESNTHYASSLESNIRSFKSGLDSEKPTGRPGSKKRKSLGHPKISSGGG